MRTRRSLGLTAFQHQRRVLRSPPEVPPPSTGRFRHFGLSTLALAIMPLTSLQMGITGALISGNAKQGAPLRPPEPLTSISSDFTRYP